jgi:excisionase family DNA binding protein
VGVSDRPGMTWSPDTADLMSLADARSMLGGISAQTLYRLIHDGDLDLVKIRRRSFIRRGDLDELVERSTRGIGTGRPTAPRPSENRHGGSRGRGAGHRGVSDTRHDERKGLSCTRTIVAATQPTAKT